MFHVQTNFFIITNIFVGGFQRVKRNQKSRKFSWRLHFLRNLSYLHLKRLTTRIWYLSNPLVKLTRTHYLYKHCTNLYGLQKNRTQIKLHKLETFFCKLLHDFSKCKTIIEIDLWQQSKTTTTTSLQSLSWEINCTSLDRMWPGDSELLICFDLFCFNATEQQGNPLKFIKQCHSWHSLKTSNDRFSLRMTV